MGRAQRWWLTCVLAAALNVALCLTVNAQTKPGGDALDAAVAQLKLLIVPANATPKGAALAAAASQEGHWTFANAAGEKFTAAAAGEIKRAVATLAPDYDAGGRLTVLLTEDTVFKRRALLKDLPKGADLRIVVDGAAMGLRARGDAATGPLLAEAKPNLFIGVSDRARFDEAVWQLNRPLKSANVRILALEPGGPQTLAPAPALDPATRRPLVDQIDPLRVADAIRNLRGQTAIVTGRAEGKLLIIRGSSGPERSVILADLTAAAEAADVDLVVLLSVAARQPGARNWFWQTVKVAGLDEALGRATLADFLNALGTGERPMAVSVPDPEPGSAGRNRVRLTIAPLADPSVLDRLPQVGRTTDAIGGAIGDAMAEMTGKLVVTGADLHLQSMTRASEIRGRLIPSIAVGWIEAYLGGILLGLLGWRWTSRWWRRVWPPEKRSDYRSAIGHLAAQGVRGILMLLVFMPAAGIMVIVSGLTGYGRKASAPTTTNSAS
jgi:hypothetical protein